MEVVIHDETDDDDNDEVTTKHSTDAKEGPKGVYGGHNHILELSCVNENNEN